MQWMVKKLFVGDAALAAAFLAYAGAMSLDNRNRVFKTWKTLKTRDVRFSGTVADSISDCRTTRIPKYAKNGASVDCHTILT